MTKEEIKKILTVIRASYPQHFSKMSAEDQIAMLEIWSEMFEDDDPILIATAVKSYIKSNAGGYPPCIGQINEIAYKLTHHRAMSEQEAWNMVYMAMCNSAYNSREEFNKLPEQIQRIVGSPRQLREWGMMDNATINTVVSSNFQRSYRSRVSNDLEIDMFPENAKKIIRSTTIDFLENL